MKRKNRMAILSSYFEGESYGLLGPQMAATIIQDNTTYQCIVIAVTRNDDKSLIKRFLSDYFGKERPVIGFSSLSGREDLFSFAKELKHEGAITILAGPQAYPDYIGEVGWKEHAYRFKGLSDCFIFSLKGPAEQAIPLLKNINNQEAWRTYPGVTTIDQDGQIRNNSAKAWDEGFLKSVNWNNLYRVGNEGLMPIKVSTGQVLQQIGCPYAGSGRWIEVDYPAALNNSKDKKIRIFSKGCSFCDVAIDKGFYGELGMKTIFSQIACLPENEDGRKIPFELINENPLFTLPDLLNASKERNIRMSQINMILRADHFLKGETRLRESLRIAGEIGTRILISSIGFEAFDDTLLRNFNKGIDVAANLKAVLLMRRLKEDFPMEWGYSKAEGAIHGFIHPTPWDTKETFVNTQKNVAIYGLDRDILPPNSTPLIIHHASALGDWIRGVEKKEGLHHRRYGSIIGWWHVEKDAYPSALRYSQT
jgi:hypothetical protein